MRDRERRAPPTQPVALELERRIAGEAAASG
jgi:hypothetical protein